MTWLLNQVNSDIASYQYRHRFEGGQWKHGVKKSWSSNEINIEMSSKELLTNQLLKQGY